VSQRHRVAVLGASGYTGGELLRFLFDHPAVEVVLASSRQHAGKPLEAAHPCLEGASALRFEDTSPQDAAKRADVIFLAMPHGESMAAVNALRPALESERPPLVIDLSGDFRLATARAYKDAYDHDHEAEGLLPRFVYGIPELLKPGELAGARLVSNPGCFATGAALSVAPLAAAGLLRGTVVVNGVTGASGSGVKPSDGTHFPARDGNFRAYKVLDHQHEPEIQQTLRRLHQHGSCAREPKQPSVDAPFELVFTAHSAPLTRGIYATATARLDSDASLARDAYARFYERARFVRLRDKPPELKAVVGTNYADIHVAARGHVVLVTVAIDNLVKGASGQAVQNMNLALGLDEGLGLGFRGYYP
jgi:N-acetyl-gamma-glutamyl-phosphate reductase